MGKHLKCSSDLLKMKLTAKIMFSKIPPMVMTFITKDMH